MIYCAYPKAQFEAHREQILGAMQNVLERGRYINGEEVEAFEREFAQYCGVAHAVGCANGTDALHLALRALEIGPGDEVITTPHTAVATVAAIELTGAAAVLVDIEPDTYALDPEKVRAAITKRTKAVIAVHIYGQPADLEALLSITREHNLKLIEDCAQAHGATWNGRRVGSVGDVGCFSFYPTKNLGAVGDGGAVVSTDPQIGERLKLLREYGWRERYVSAIPGMNSRLDELQAAILRVKLRSLDADNARRNVIAKRYNAELAKLPVTIPALRDGVESVFHLYVIRVPNRDHTLKQLHERGIGALIHYPMPVHLQPAYVGRVGSLSLPVAEKAATEILSLPMYPELTDEEVGQVIEALRQVFAS